jgi:CheY-like chemotaxis protein
MAATTRLRVLVADSNADAADSLVILLACWGYEARAAYSGPDALRIAIDFLPDVALLELVLRGLDGCELARRLRDQPALRRMACVAVTTSSAAEDLRRAEEAGYLFRFLKPADPASLGQLLAALARLQRRDATA